MSAYEKSPRSSRAVTLSAEDAAHAARLIELLGGNDNVAFERVEPPHGFESDRLRAIACLVQVVRSTRTKHFSPAMFGEPAWDLLVALYADEPKSHVGHTVTTLAKRADVPVSTALRWIKYLEEKKLVLREVNSADRRATAVTLSTKGRNALENYFEDIIECLAAAPLR